MNILVVDVAASESGALTILKQYYEDLSNDKSNHYYFCVSTPKLNDRGNITILSFPWVKKSWLHRLWFDHVVSGRLLRKHKIDQIFSLQNTVLPHAEIAQTVYLHQSLPFVEHRFKLSENKLLWVYQNVISRIIYKSMKKATAVITQTQWMKDEVVNRCKVSADKILVKAPKVDNEGSYQFYDTLNNRKTFFYPATAFEYKNHRLIIQACNILKERGVHDYNINFTLSGTENDYSIEIKNNVAKYKLPINFLGKLSQHQVFQKYAESVLVFPSYVESHPMPLKEARVTGTYILTSDCAFSKEILINYKKASFFKTDDPDELADLMEKVIMMK